MTELIHYGKNVFDDPRDEVLRQHLDDVAYRQSRLGNIEATRVNFILPPMVAWGAEVVRQEQQRLMDEQQGSQDKRTLEWLMTLKRMVERHAEVSGRSLAEVIRFYGFDK
jgi:hypothetical protein